MPLSPFTNDHALHNELIKVAPPVGVGTLTLLGYNLSDIALIITIVYTLCVFFVLIRDKFIGHYLRKSNNTPIEES